MNYPALMHQADEPPVLIVFKPVLTYILRTLIWLVVSIGLGLLFGWLLAAGRYDYDLSTPPPKPAAPPQVKLEPVREVSFAEKLVACETASSKLLNEKGIHFGNNSTQLSPQDKVVVGEIILALTQCKGATLQIEGHTDNIGSAAKNLQLSKARAEAVAQVIREHGMNDFKYRIYGMGSEFPRATNDTPEGRQENRRIEIHLYQ